MLTRKEVMNYLGINVEASVKELLSSLTPVRVMAACRPIFETVTKKLVVKVPKLKEHYIESDYGGMNFKATIEELAADKALDLKIAQAMGVPSPDPKVIPKFGATFMRLTSNSGVDLGRNSRGYRVSISMLDLLNAANHGSSNTRILARLHVDREAVERKLNDMTLAKMVLSLTLTLIADNPIPFINAYVELLDLANKVLTNGDLFKAL